MDALDYSTKALAWIGLVCASLLGAGTLLVWGVWLYEKLLELLPHPRTLWRATKAALILSFTKNKADHVAGWFSDELDAALNDPEFAKAWAYFRRPRT